MLSRGNAMAVWQGLVDDHGCAARHASVCRFELLTAIDLVSTLVSDELLRRQDPLIRSPRR
jgi:hypothetical protein